MSVSLFLIKYFCILIFDLSICTNSNIYGDLPGNSPFRKIILKILQWFSTVRQTTFSLNKVKLSPNSLNSFQENLMTVLGVLYCLLPVLRWLSLVSCLKCSLVLLVGTSVTLVDCPLPGKGATLSTFQDCLTSIPTSTSQYLLRLENRNCSNDKDQFTQELNLILKYYLSQMEFQLAFTQFHIKVH